MRDAAVLQRKPQSLSFARPLLVSGLYWQPGQKLPSCAPRPNGPSPCDGARPRPQTPQKEDAAPAASI